MSPCWQVQSDHNFDLVLQYLASFAHDLPRRKELEAWSSNQIHPRSYLFWYSSIFIDMSLPSWCPLRPQIFVVEIPQKIRPGQACLAWASSHYRLNPWRRFEQHQAWYTATLLSFKLRNFIRRYPIWLCEKQIIICCHAEGSWFVVRNMTCIGLGHSWSGYFDGSGILVHGSLSEKSWGQAWIWEPGLSFQFTLCYTSIIHWIQLI